MVNKYDKKSLYVQPVPPYSIIAELSYVAGVSKKFYDIDIRRCALANPV